MSEYLEFRKVQCKDCYLCLRECPVKAIDVTNHQAKIIEDRCILCGHCTHICPQNAKIVHSELANIMQMIENGEKVIASVAPSFISNFGLKDFSALKIALAKLGFYWAEETAVGAQAVVEEYKKHLQKGDMRNIITTACPAACQLIQKFYPKALPFLAPVDSPMIAHAKIIRKEHPDAKIVFIGPCISKKKEAAESEFLNGVMSFEELRNILEEKNISLENISNLNLDDKNKAANKAKAFPVTRGIIHSFDSLPEGYQYMTVDGVERCMEALEHIESLDHVFLEMNVCPSGCVNGPCSIPTSGGILKAEADIYDYVRRELENKPSMPTENTGIDFSHTYPRLRNQSRPATEKEIEAVMHKTGKFRPEDELNCGACGYKSCREKAWAVVNGYADTEICLPYMRKRAESLAVEIVHNSPEGVIIVDSEMNIVDANATAMKMLGISGDPDNFYARPLSNYFSPFDFYEAFSKKHTIEVKEILIGSTQRYVNIKISLLNDGQRTFGILTDVTDEVNYDKKLDQLKSDTIETTDQVIMKQMRVAQEIASLLGETTAETKVALLKLKKMLQDSSQKEV